MKKNKNNATRVQGGNKGNPQDGTRKSTERIEQQAAAQQRKKAAKATKNAARANNSNQTATSAPAYFVKNGETDLKKILIAERKAEAPAIKAAAREIQRRILDGETVAPEELQTLMKAKALIEAELEEAAKAKARAEAEAIAAKAKAEAEAEKARKKAERNQRVQARKAERKEALAGGGINFSELFGLNI